MFVECKISDRKLSPHLRYLHLKYPEVPAIQVVMECESDIKSVEGVRICPAEVFLNELI